MDIVPVIIAGSSAVIALLLVAAFGAGWYAGRRGPASRVSLPSSDQDQATAMRISVADLRTRMRRLEAIAAGIDV